MAIGTQTIEVDQDTATTLEARAAERGVTVRQLVAELVPMAADAEALIELDQRWTAVRAGGETASQEEVERWLETWGTPSFRPRT